MIRAGSLNCQLTIQELPKSDGFTDVPPQDWITIGHAWGTPLPKKGQEKFVQPEYLASVDYVFQTTYTPLLTPNRRLLFRDRILNVSFAMDPEQRNEQLIVGCTEVVKD
jgi:SPP1 family predicted phage head-tail adaptor